MKGFHIGGHVVCIKDNWEEESEDGLLCLLGSPVRHAVYAVDGLCTTDPTDLGLKFDALPLVGADGSRNHGWSASNFRRLDASPAATKPKPRPVLSNAKTHTEIERREG